MNQPPQPVVAVVDDDASLRRSLGNLLGSVGLAVATYASAEEFLATARLVELGLVVLDLRLSAMSGLELASLLRARRAQLPIVFLSAQGDPATRRRCLEAGATAFVAKPFLPDLLLRTVRAALEAS